MQTIRFLLIGLLVLGALLLAVQLFMSRSTNRIERYDYEVLKDFNNFEIRKYAPAKFSYVTMASNSYKQSSSNGFRLLASYIFGNNKESEKIAMTSPVAMEMADSITMKFMIPSKYKLEDLPLPNDTRVQFRSEPEKYIAAIRFGGWANDKKIERISSKLSDLLKKEGIEQVGNFNYLGYNPPFELFFRRNEIIVEIDPTSLQTP
jgi:hypothetical protein